MRSPRDVLRVHRHAIQEPGTWRGFAHVYRLLRPTTVPCGSCSGTGIETQQPVDRPESEWRVQARRDAGIDSTMCFACRGLGTRPGPEEEKFGEARLEVTANRGPHPFLFAETAVSAGRVQVSAAVPFVGAFWATVKFPFGPLTRLWWYFGPGPCSTCNWRGQGPWQRRSPEERAKCPSCRGSGRTDREVHEGWLTSDTRETGINVAFGTARIKLFATSYGSTSSPRFRGRRPAPGRRRRHRPMGLHDDKSPALLRSGFEWSFRILPLDVIFGERRRTAVEVLSEQETVVPLPEGSYPATVRLERWTYARPRWPRWPLGPDRSFHGNVDLTVPIPEPGKGENSWDCDDDATFSSSGPWSSVGEAVGAVAGSVMRTRGRRAGPGWRPDAGWPDGIQPPTQAPAR